MMAKQILWLVIGLLLIASVLAITPQGNFDMRDLYNMTGANQIESNQFCIGANCVTTWSIGTVTDITFTAPQLIGGEITSSGTVELNVTWLSGQFLNLTSQIYNETALFDKLVVSNASMDARVDLAEASIVSLDLSNITLTAGIAGLVNSNTSIWGRLNGLTNDNTTVWGRLNGLTADNTSIRAITTALTLSNASQEARLLSLDTSNLTLTTALAARLVDNSTQAAQILLRLTGITGTAPIVTDNSMTPVINITVLKDLVTTAPLTGGTNDILTGADGDITLAITMEGDLVTTAPITGGVNDIFPGTGTKATIALNLLKDIVTTGPWISGGENDVLPGTDADLTLAVNVSQIELTYQNRSLWTTHDNYPANCGVNNFMVNVGDTNVCAQPNAANLTSGTFGGTDYTMPANLTVTSNLLIPNGKRLSLNNSGTTGLYMTSNSSCLLFIGSTITFAVC